MSSRCFQTLWKNSKCQMPNGEPRWRHRAVIRPSSDLFNTFEVCQDKFWGIMSWACKANCRQGSGPPKARGELPEFTARRTKHCSCFCRGSVASHGPSGSTPLVYPFKPGLETQKTVCKQVMLVTETQPSLTSEQPLGRAFQSLCQWSPTLAQVSSWHIKTVCAVKIY